MLCIFDPARFPQLLEAQKPHSKAVTDIKLSPDGSLLTTCSADGTVFFFAVKQRNEPIGPCFFLLCVATSLRCPCFPHSFLLSRVHTGFYQVDRKINTLCFPPDRPDTLLLGAQDGKIVEVSLPDCSAVDNSESYELDFKQRLFKYTYTTTIVVSSSLSFSLILLLHSVRVCVRVHCFVLWRC